ncbi:sirohydrochlorin chelatase [Microbacterium sp. NPDC078428]|uniref:sirohydrochlorin chelatase n=1 Tax=Microbacterium sp. NPDC078428 TaxID=3364190 RepID=UPI0037C8A83D
MTPTLIACSHGTRSHEGRQAISTLLDQVRTLVPGVRIEEAFVDVQEPAIDEVVDRAVAEGPAVVVPVLLSTGYHTRVDIARAVAAHPGRAIAAPALGPHDLLALVLESRLADADLQGGDAIVLAAAGSSDPSAAIDVQAMADRLSQCVFAPITVGFAAGAHPRIDAAVESARAAGAERVIAASYVLAPGYFADVIGRAGADAVTAPLAPDVRIAALIVERFRAAAGQLHGAAALAK